MEYEGQKVPCVHPIEWYENEGAWQVVFASGCEW